MELPLEVSVEDVKARIDAGENLLLLDVRQLEEYEVCHMDNTVLLPMGMVDRNLSRLKDREEAIIVICHHGIRSLNVAAWLRDSGVLRVQSMAGGVDAWSLRIDPRMPRY